MTLLPTTYEKRWPTVILTPISIIDSQVIVTSTLGLHTKQKITLSMLGVPVLEAEIKRILSDTRLLIGPPGDRIQVHYNQNDLADYDGGTLTMSEQGRNPIASEYVLRATYEEEPAVALRTLLVDAHGQFYLENNPLWVTFRSFPVHPNLINAVMLNADTEYEIVIPDRTVRFKFKARPSNAKLQFAFTSGESGSNFITLHPGAVQEEWSGLVEGQRLYVRSSKPNTTVELLAWTMV